MKDTFISYYPDNNDDFSNFSTSNDFFSSRKLSFEFEKGIFDKEVDSFEIINTIQGLTSNTIVVQKKPQPKRKRKNSNRVIIASSTIDDTIHEKENKNVINNKQNKSKSRISDEANRLAVKRFREKQKNTINELLEENNKLRNMLNEKYETAILSILKEPIGKISDFIGQIRKRVEDNKLFE